MPDRFRLTVAVTLFLSGAYFVYGLGIDQLLGEDRSQLTPHTRPEQPQLELDDAGLVTRRYLREHTWVEQSGIQLRDGKRLFYFSQSWTETENKREVRFEPLAIVWFSKKQKEPLTIVAESALVTFESDVDLANPEPGRIVGGELTGKVSIRGPKQLRIDGRHFIFSEKAASIWSDDAVSFGYADRNNGKSQTASGTADQGIQIDLDVETAPSSDQPIAVGAIREIHLRRRVEIDFEFEQAGRTVPLGVSCNGRFSLAMTDPAIDPAEPMIATFEDDVLVRRLWPDNQPDTLTCDTLRLFLNRVSPFDKPDQPISDSTAESPLGSDIQLRWMRATGQRVVLRSPKEELTAVCSASRSSYFTTKKTTFAKFSAPAREYSRTAKWPTNPAMARRHFGRCSPRSGSANFESIPTRNRASTSSTSVAVLCCECRMRKPPFRRNSSRSGSMS